MMQDGSNTVQLCESYFRNKEKSEMPENWFSLVLPAILLIVFLLLLYLFCDWLLYKSKVVGGAVDRWVLITGCDTGFGHQAAKQLDSVGCRVIAACLSHEGCSTLSKTCSSRLVPVMMDVTNEESVQQAFQTVSGLFGPGQGSCIDIHVLVIFYVNYISLTMPTWTWLRCAAVSENFSQVFYATDDLIELCY
jgi:short chain dehydrogenase